jgi:Flp pilus assembly protein TadB
MNQKNVAYQSQAKSSTTQIPFYRSEYERNNIRCININHNRFLNHKCASTKFTNNNNNISIDWNKNISNFVNFVVVVVMKFVVVVMVGMVMVMVVVVVVVVAVVVMVVVVVVVVVEVVVLFWCWRWLWWWN